MGDEEGGENEKDYHHERQVKKQKMMILPQTRQAQNDRLESCRVTRCPSLPLSLSPSLPTFLSPGKESRWCRNKGIPVVCASRAAV